MEWGLSSAKYLGGFEGRAWEGDLLWDEKDNPRATTIDTVEVVAERREMSEDYSLWGEQDNLRATTVDAMDDVAWDWEEILYGVNRIIIGRRRLTRCVTSPANFQLAKSISLYPSNTLKRRLLG